MQEERPEAEQAQAGGVSASASRSRAAGVGTGQQQQQLQQEQAGLSVLIECHQGPRWPWGHRRHGPILKEVIMSFKRRAPEEPGRSSWSHSSLQQQHGLEVREPQRQGQGSSLRHPQALDGTPGVSVNSRMGWPETGQDRPMGRPWPTGYTTAQQPQLIRRGFAEGTMNNKAILERPGDQAPPSKPVVWTMEQECEDALGPELSEEEQWEDALDVEVSDEEEWQDAVDTELCKGTDDIELSPVLHWVNSLGLQDNRGSQAGPKEGPSCPTGEGTTVSGTLEGSQDKERPLNERHEGEDGTATLTPAAQEKPSMVGKEAVAQPDQGQAFTNTIPLPTYLDAPAEVSQMWRRKALTALQALPALPGQQLLQAESVLQEAGPPAGPAFTSPSPTVIDALSRERRMSDFQRAPRVLLWAFTAPHRRGGQEKQQPTACAWDLPDTAQNSSSEVLSKARIVIQGLKQTEEQKYPEHSTDATMARRAGAAGAVSLAHAPHSPTADGRALLDTVQYTTDEILSRAMIVTHRSEEHTEQQRDLEQGTAEGMRVTAPAEETKSQGPTVHSQTDDGLVFLDYHDYVLTEVVKKAVLMVQKPFEYSEEKQDQQGSVEGSTTAEKPAGRAKRLPASTLNKTPARQRWLRPVRKASKALPLFSTATSSAEKKEKKHPAADGKDLLDTAECIRRDVPDKATPEIQGSSQQLMDQQNVEHSRDVSPTAAGTKSHGHETQSPTADAVVFLRYNDCLQTEVVKKAVIVVQEPFEYSEEPQEQEGSID